MGACVFHSGPVSALGLFRGQELLAFAGCYLPTPNLCWLMSGLDRCLLNEHLSRSQETKVQSSPRCVTLVK